MRSGLQKTGVVPLVALVLFFLLSLVPTLAKEWEWDVYKYGVNLAYLAAGRGGLPRYDGLYSARAENASASIDTLTGPRSRSHSHSHSHSRLLRTDTHYNNNNEPCKSWLFGYFYSTCIDRKSQPHSLPSYIPPRSSFEVGSGSGSGSGTDAEPQPAHLHDPVTVYATKEPSSITRGVSAIKEFVIKRWDGDGVDQQIQTQTDSQARTQTRTRTQPLPPSHVNHGLDTADNGGLGIHPTPTSATNVSSTLASTRGRETGKKTGQADDPVEDFAQRPFLRLPLFMLETWQQVCQSAGSHFESLKNRIPIHYNHTLIPIPKFATPALFDYERAHPNNLQNRSQTQKQQCTSADDVPLNTSGIYPSNHTPSETQTQTPLRGPQNSTSSSNSNLLVTAGQSKYIGFRRDSDSNSEHMCGSSMAIVIALVVGIMWF